MKIRIYTTNNCSGCTQTKNYLENKHMTPEFLKPLGVDMEYVNLSENPDILAKVKEEGFREVPIIKVERGLELESWTGFIPSKLGELVKEIEAVELP